MRQFAAHSLRQRRRSQRVWRKLLEDGGPNQGYTITLPGFSPPLEDTTQVKSPITESNVIWTFIGVSVGFLVGHLLTLYALFNIPVGQ